MNSNITQHKDLSVYALPGRVKNAAVALDEARDAEQAGFGTIYLSERLDMKEAGAVCGAMTAVTSKINIATGLIHQVTRHPVTIAAMAATLQQMSGGRFVLGIGRGVGPLAPSLGVKPATLASLEQLASTLKRLWAGERITEEGPLGKFSGLRFVDQLSEPPPPIIFGTFGQLGLKLAGRCFDGVLLHPFLTVEAVANAVKIVRESAEAAGRDPASVRIINTLIAAPDLSQERIDLAIKARAISYFQLKGLGDQLVERNQWDPQVLEKIRSHSTLANKGMADTSLSRQQLIQAAEAIPDEWYQQGAALGSSEFCAQRAREYKNVGVDEILIHGASPKEASGIAKIWSDK
ncbi:MAG: TIGR03857 family LLM class F420-dependent oxidoreductase [Spongiibacteraceae bacterium]